MMEKKSKLFSRQFIILGLVAIILSAYFAFGAIVVKNSADGSTGFGINQSGIFVLNFTINNTEIGPLNETVNITQINITLPSGLFLIVDSNQTSENMQNGTFSYLNLTSGNVLTWFNESILINGTDASGRTDFGHFWFNVSANGSTVGRFNITIDILNGSSTGAGASLVQTNISIQINDTTVPDVAFGDGTTPVQANTSSIYINASISDNNEANRSFIVNSSEGIVNKSTFTDRTATINFTAANLSDGHYNISILVSDNGPSDTGIPNTNSTIERVVILDRTAPVLSHSCDKTSVNTGDTITCTCGVTDATTGVLTSSFTAKPSTSGTGSYTTTCTATDYVGNSASNSISYTVEQGSSGSGGGGGGESTTTATTWKKTHITTLEQVSAGFTKSVAKNERVRVSINNEDHHVGIKELTSNSATIEVSSTPQSATLNVGETKKFEVTDDNYYDLVVTLNSITNNKADITIKSINEEIPVVSEEVVEETTTEEEPVALAPEESSSGLSGLIIGILIFLFVIVVLVVVYLRMRKTK